MAVQYHRGMGDKSFQSKKALNGWPREESGSRRKKAEEDYPTRKWGNVSRRRKREKNVQTRSGRRLPEEESGRRLSKREQRGKNVEMKKAEKTVRKEESGEEYA